MPRSRWRTSGYRSGLEKRLKENINEKLKNKFRKIKLGYEDTKLAYVTEHNYIPDFTLYGRDDHILYIEAKGNLDNDSKRKMVAVKSTHPDLDIRFIFQRDNFIRKGSKTTYTMWADKHGFPSHVGEDIPIEWLKELL